MNLRESIMPIPGLSLLLDRMRTIERSLSRNSSYNALVFPLSEIAAYALPRSKILGNHASPTACFEKI
jgi:hypothetical protein